MSNDGLTLISLGIVVAIMMGLYFMISVNTEMIDTGFTADFSETYTVTNSTTQDLNTNQPLLIDVILLEYDGEVWFTVPSDNWNVNGVVITISW